MTEIRSFPDNDVLIIQLYIDAAPWRKSTLAEIFSFGFTTGTLQEYLTSKSTRLLKMH